MANYLNLDPLTHEYYVFLPNQVSTTITHTLHLPIFLSTTLHIHTLITYSTVYTIHGIHIFTIILSANVHKPTIKSTLSNVRVGSRPCCSTHHTYITQYMYEVRHAALWMHRPCCPYLQGAQMNIKQNHSTKNSLFLADYILDGNFLPIKGIWGLFVIGLWVWCMWIRPCVWRMGGFSRSSGVTSSTSAWKGPLDRHERRKYGWYMVARI